MGRVLDVFWRYPCFYRSNHKSSFRIGDVSALDWLRVERACSALSPLHSACSMLATGAHRMWQSVQELIVCHVRLMV